ncbi:unnamed protein product, partial [Prorocentrum cordatum]
HGNVANPRPLDPCLRSPDRKALPCRNKDKRRREGGGKEGRKARQSGTDAEAWGPPPVAPARGTPAHAPSARPSSRGPRRARAREGRPPVAGLGLPPRPAGRILGGSQAGPASTFACRARTLRHDN